MQLSPKLVRDKVIIPALEALDPTVPYSAQAVELLLGTAATESHMGLWLRQLGGGPALGLYQMEPATEKDIWRNFLAYKPDLELIVRGWKKGLSQELEWNHAYSTAMARIHYFRVKEPLPEVGDIPGFARYWKQYYNTPLGKGTEEKFIKDWKEFIDGKI